ncbi:zinc-binding dehydrogenase, partial [Streptomyces griseoloalbus]|uniref:zinc-binding dehydrogenase n=1 Tax=Streptomyces griseoloalbus TaxID=67303 RepID=UPI001875B953
RRRRPERRLTCGDSGVSEAAELGVRTSFTEDRSGHTADALAEFARLAAEGRFGIPVAGTAPLEDEETARRISRSNRARGKLLLLP